MIIEAIKLTDVADLLRSFAWPVAVLVIVLVFRRPLQQLLHRSNVQMTAPGGVSVSFTELQAAAGTLEDASRDRGKPVSAGTIEREVAAASQTIETLGRAPRVLWVDDEPSNNRRESQALSSLGMSIESTTSTENALAIMATRGPYDAVISDMRRPRDDRAGYTLLDALRHAGNATPFVIYSSSSERRHFDEAVSHGAVGSTDSPTDLIQLIREALAHAPRNP